MPPGGDAGLHVHLREDESMHLLERQLEVAIGERTFDLKPGESYFAPRGVPQGVRNRGTVAALSCVGAEGRRLRRRRTGGNRLAGETSSRRTTMLVASE